MINIFIQCRINSTRLPGKALIKFFNLKIIERIILIAKKTNFKKKIFILSGSKKKNFELKKIAEKYNVNIFFGNETNVLKRYCDAIDFYALNHNESIMRLTADNYLIQPQVLNRMSQFKNKYEYIYVDPLSHFAGEIFIINSLLKKIKRKNNSFNTREHVTWNFRKLKKFKIKKLSKKFLGINHSNKITLDNYQDLKFMREIEKNINFKKVDCIKNLIKLSKKKILK